MGLLPEIVLVLLLINASMSVRVTLENGQTGTVVKTQLYKTNVTLQCSASGNGGSGSPSLEWLYDTSPNSAGTHLVYNTQLVMNTDSRISITNPYSLTISSLRLSDTGFYTCRVVIPGDVPSVDEAKYDFTVLAPPYTNVSCGFPQDLKITLGHSSSFRCHEEITQAVPAPTYIWYKNGVALPTTRTGNPMYNNASFSYSKQTGVLTFSSVVDGDAGEYYCAAENEFGSGTSSKAYIETRETLSAGAIAGIVIGAIGVLILIGVVVWSVV